MNESHEPFQKDETHLFEAAFFDELAKNGEVALAHPQGVRLPSERLMKRQCKILARKSPPPPTLEASEVQQKEKVHKEENLCGKIKLSTDKEPITYNDLWRCITPWSLGPRNMNIQRLMKLRL